MIPGTHLIFKMWYYKKFCSEHRSGAKLVDLLNYNILLSSSWNFTANTSIFDYLTVSFVIKRKLSYFRFNSQSWLSLSRTNFLVPCKFEIVRVNCIYFYRVNTSRTWSLVNWLILINLISKFFVRNSPLLKSLSECLSFKYNFVSPLLKLITAISWRYG